VRVAHGSRLRSREGIPGEDRRTTGRLGELGPSAISQSLFTVELKTGVSHL
jgi:hypothetical protein